MTTPLPPTVIATLDRITDRTPDDLVEIKEYLGLAASALAGKCELEKLNKDQRMDVDLAYNWVGEAADLLDMLAGRLGYTLPE